MKLYWLARGWFDRQTWLLAWPHFQHVLNKYEHYERDGLIEYEFPQTDKIGVTGKQTLQSSFSNVLYIYMERNTTYNTYQVSY